MRFFWKCLLAFFVLYILHVQNTETFFRKAASVEWIQNVGQVNSDILFYTYTKNGAVAITRRALFYYFLDGQKLRVVSETVFVNEKPAKFEVVPMGRRTVKLNYIKDKKPENWFLKVPVFAEVQLKLHNGVNIHLLKKHNGVEKIFEADSVQPIEQVRFRVEGVDELVLKGRRIAFICGKDMACYSSPVAWSGTKSVKVAYKLFNKQTWGLCFEEKDRSRTVVDPLLASTYLGGGDDDEACDIAVDASGYVYVAGTTESSDFPVKPGSYDTTHNGWEDIFVSKFSSDLQTLLASTFIGGSNDDEAHSLILLSDGSVVVVGETKSSNFPIVSGYDSSYGGGGDAVICKLSSDLSSLTASTYFGGSNYDSANDVAVDSSGNIFVAGPTSSSGLATAGAYQTSLKGSSDIYIAKFSSDLSSLAACTYFGGSNEEYNWECKTLIEIAENGKVYVAGYTKSSDLPMAGSPYKNSLDGSADVFLARFSSSLSSLECSTYIGGYSQYDFCYGMDTKNNNICIVGWTNSKDWPTTASGYDLNPDDNGWRIGYVTMLNSDLSCLVASTLLGDGGDTWVEDVFIDPEEKIFVTGFTISETFPTSENCFESCKSPYRDAFICRFDFYCSDLEASTYIGGEGYDEAYGIYVKGNNVYVVGETSSSYFPVTSNAYQSSKAGDYDAFVIKFDRDLSKNSGAPNLISPADGSVLSDPSPTFQWSSVSGALWYKLKLSKDPNFTPGSNTKIIYVGNTTSWTLDPSVLDDTYYWKVAANNTGWSDGWSFTIKISPDFDDYAVIDNWELPPASAWTNHTYGSSYVDSTHGNGADAISHNKEKPWFNYVLEIDYNYFDYSGYTGWRGTNPEDDGDTTSGNDPDGYDASSYDGIAFAIRTDSGTSSLKVELEDTDGTKKSVTISANPDWQVYALQFSSFSGVNPSKIKAILFTYTGGHQIFYIDNLFFADFPDSSKMTFKNVDSQYLYGGSSGNLVLDFRLGGFSPPKTLSEIRIKNIEVPGLSRASSSDVTLKLYRDGSNEGWNGDEVYMGTLSYTGSYIWKLSSINYTVPSSGKEFFVTVDVSSSATDGSTLKLVVDYIKYTDGTTFTNLNLGPTKIYGLYTETFTASSGYDCIKFNTNNPPDPDGGTLGYWYYDYWANFTTDTSTYTDGTESLLLDLGPNDPGHPEAGGAGEYVAFGYPPVGNNWTVPTDMRDYKGGWLRFDIKLDTSVRTDNTHYLFEKVEWGASGTEDYKLSLWDYGVKWDSSWQHVMIRLSDFKGIDYKVIKVPYGTHVACTGRHKFWVDNVRWESPFFVIDTSPPPTPTNFSITAYNTVFGDPEDKVVISWQPPSPAPSDLIGYYVYYSEDASAPWPDGWTRVHEEEPGDTPKRYLFMSTSYEDSTVVPGVTKRWYRVVSVDDAFRISAPTSPLCAPAIKTDKEVTASSRRPFETYTYTIKFNNWGYGPACNMIIEECLPSNVELAAPLSGPSNYSVAKEYYYGGSWHSTFSSAATRIRWRFLEEVPPNDMEWQDQVQFTVRVK